MSQTIRWKVINTFSQKFILTLWSKLLLMFIRNVGHHNHTWKCFFAFHLHWILISLILKIWNTLCLCRFRFRVCRFIFIFFSSNEPHTANIATHFYISFFPSQLVVSLFWTLIFIIIIFFSFFDFHLLSLSIFISRLTDKSTTCWSFWYFLPAFLYILWMNNFFFFWISRKIFLWFLHMNIVDLVFISAFFLFRVTWIIDSKFLHSFMWQDSC